MTPTPEIAKAELDLIRAVIVRAVRRGEDPEHIKALLDIEATKANEFTAAVVSSSLFASAPDTHTRPEARAHDQGVTP